MWNRTHFHGLSNEMSDYTNQLTARVCVCVCICTCVLPFCLFFISRVRIEELSLRFNKIFITHKTSFGFDFHSVPCLLLHYFNPKKYFNFLIDAIPRGIFYVSSLLFVVPFINTMFLLFFFSRRFSDLSCGLSGVPCGCRSLKRRSPLLSGRVLYHFLSFHVCLFPFFICHIHTILYIVYTICIQFYV